MEGSETAVWFSRRAFLAGALACGGCSIIGGGGGGQGGGFGTTIQLGPVADLDAALAQSNFWYLPEGRAWIVAVAPEWREPLKAVTDERLHNGIDAGYAALFQTCPHLGCRVPECVESGQFECPCHGSVYGPLGEKRGGPSPRGMDRFALWVENGEAFVDTGTIIPGLPIGTELGEPVEPVCVEPVES